MSLPTRPEPDSRPQPTARPGWQVVAMHLAPAFAHRTWSLAPGAPNPQCHAFLLVHGRARLSVPAEPELDLDGPCLVWLPPDAEAEYRLLAGGDGATFSVAEEFAWRTVADSPVGTQLRPLLARRLVVPAERIGAHVAELVVSFEAMARESRENQSAASAMLAAHLALVLLHLWRATGLAATAKTRRGAGASTAQRFRQLVEIHYREHIGIDDYARELGVTRGHLHDACLKTTGRTPLAIVHERLIEASRERLEQSTLPVEQVAYSLGFRDPAYFSRFFKRMTGTRPGAYRQGLAAQNSPDRANSFAAWP